MLDRLPLSLQQYLLLEWLSPESVFVLAGVSVGVRCDILESSSSSSSSTPSSSSSGSFFYRAAEGEILSDPCVHWFSTNGLPLRLWSHCVRINCGQLFRPFCFRKTEHRTNGKLHSENDLPAEIWSDGAQVWYRHGKRHRDGDLPALVGSSMGAQAWYQNGKLHRDGDRPAIVHSDGLLEWWRDGIRLQQKPSAEP